jgi:hypothetical protein
VHGCIAVQQFQKVSTHSSCISKLHGLDFTRPRHLVIPLHFPAYIRAVVPCVIRGVRYLVAVSLVDRSHESEVQPCTTWRLGDAG